MDKKQDNRTWPNLFIAGFPKCGTTSLYNYLAEHPDIYAPELKEPRYLFLDYINLNVEKLLYKAAIKTEDEYIGLYKDGAGFRYRMDGTPGYAFYPGSIEAIKEMGEDVRVILSIRNHADRLISLFKMQYNRGYTEKSFEELFQARKDRNLKRDQPTMYYDAIRNVFDILGRDRVHVMVFEDWTGNPEKALSGIHEFLGIENIMPENAGKAYFSNKKVLKSSFIRKLHGGRFMTFIYPRLGGGIKKLGKMILQNKMLYKEQNVSDSLREEIQEYYKNDTELVQELTGLDLSGWKRG